MNISIQDSGNTETALDKMENGTIFRFSKPDESLLTAIKGFNLWVLIRYIEKDMLIVQLGGDNVVVKRPRKMFGHILKDVIITHGDAALKHSTLAQLQIGDIVRTREEVDSYSASTIIVKDPTQSRAIALLNTSNWQLEYRHPETQCLLAELAIEIPSGNI